ncbi:MAG: hypothetical protein ACJ789_16170 [Thermomicrobiales bacterium]
MRALGARSAMATGLLAVLMFFGLTPGVAAQNTQTDLTSRAYEKETKHLRAAIEKVLSPETNRGGQRLPSVRIDKTGDATVVFAMRDAKTLKELRAKAIADAITILKATYDPPVSDKIMTVTVVGTYPVTSERGTREWPVLRVTLSADSTRTLKFDKLTAKNIDQEVDVFWIYPPLIEAEG